MDHSMLKKSMVTLRFGLQKHFLKTRKEDIINLEQYQSANEMAVCVQLKKEGYGETKHKESITPEDLNKLYSSDCVRKDKPESLQYRVFFEYLYYYCHRGRENVRDVQKSDFEIKTDSQVRRYISIKKKRQTKNHRGDVLLTQMIKMSVCMKDQVFILQFTINHY